MNQVPSSTQKRQTRASGINIRRNMPRLPRTIHFISQTPHLHAIQQVSMSILLSAVGPLSSNWQIAIFEELCRFSRARRAEIDRHHWLGSQLPAPIHELIGAKLIRLDAAAQAKSGQTGSFITRADAILPVIRADEISPRIAHHRKTEWPQRIQHVAPKSLFIASRIARIVYALVNRPAKMLQKSAENSTIHDACGVLNIEMHCCGQRSDVAVISYVLRLGMMAAELAFREARSLRIRPVVPMCGKV